MIEQDTENRIVESVSPDLAQQDFSIETGDIDLDGARESMMLAATSVSEVDEQMIEIPLSESEDLIAHGWGGHQIENGTAAGMHAVRHMNEMGSFGAISVQRAQDAAEDILNRPSSVTERQKGVDYFNAEMANRSYNNAGGHLIGSGSFTFQAEMDRNGVVDIRKVGR